jgi:glycosyltransferase involved in cell wall biosynthesis
VSKSLNFALVMDLALGWRTNYRNWVDHFPQDMNVKPTWIVLSEDKTLWIDKVQGIPSPVKKRLRAGLILREGLKQGPFDATFIAASSAWTILPRYMKKHPCFLYIDATPKQLFEFGDFYGWYPSKNLRVENWKHQKRAAAYQQARGIFSTSQWAADSAIDAYGALPANLHILPWGVDLNQWQPGNPAQKLAKGICDLLFVGGDFVRKGGPRLLEWAAETQLTGWRLHLVTPQTIETKDNRVSVYNDLTSNDPRLQQLYSHADAFVLPTLADCSPFAGIEALASGLPLVITATGGTSEIVQPNKTGYLLPQNDPSALPRSLEALISSPELRARMGQAARKDAEERYSAPKVIREAVQTMKNSL